MTRFFAFLVIALCLLAPEASFAQNQEFSGGGKTIVPEDAVIDTDYGAVGEIIEIAGTIRGDAYVAGGQIFISGVIEGDLLALGGTVHVSGEVKQNIRVLGGQVVVSGNVGRNVTVGAMNATFTDAARIDGSLVAGASTVFLSAPVGKEARVASRNFTGSNAVAGNLEVASENVRLTQGAKVGGQFTYWSNQEALVAPGVLVEGAIQRKAPAQLLGGAGELVSSAQRFLKPLLGVVSFFSTFILGLLLLYLFPRYTQQSVQTLRKRPLHSVMHGVSALLVIPLAFGLLIITIVGIPLGFLLLFVSSVILYVARIFVMMLVGQLLLERVGWGQRKAVAFLVGLVLYAALGMVPVISWPVSFLAVLFGLGAAVHAAKDNLIERRKTKITL